MERKQRQAQEEIERKHRAMAREINEKQEISSFFANDTIDESNENQNDDNLYEEKRMHCREKNGCSITIPHDILKK